MRVKRKVYYPSIMSLGALLDLNDIYDVMSPDEREDPNEVIASEVFHRLKPGNERVFILLRADGMTYATISEITGVSESQIKNTIYAIRKRLLIELKSGTLMQ